MILSSETACKCKCGLNVQPDFLVLLNEIRRSYNKPVIVLSGARCPTHNASVGGSKNSSHIEGLAVDLMRSASLRTFLEANLNKFDIYMEAPQATGNDENGWLHITTRAPASGKRIFLP
jgi:hypothetical protein